MKPIKRKAKKGWMCSISFDHELLHTNVDVYQKKIDAEKKHPKCGVIPVMIVPVEKKRT